MRLLNTSFVFSLLLLSMNAVATEAVVATDYTCKELKALVKESRKQIIETPYGNYTTYYSSKACFEQGMKTKYLSVETKSGSCVAGLVCDIYGTEN